MTLEAFLAHNLTHTGITCSMEALCHFVSHPLRLVPNHTQAKWELWPGSVSER